MKVVLVRPNYQSHIITPPLGLGYLASYLKRAGIATTLLDGLRDNLKAKVLLKRILSENPQAVGITCLTAYYNEAVELSRLLKKHGVRVILGGMHPTFMPYETLSDSNADYVIRGEGEIALLKLVQNGFVNDGIAGVYSKSDIENGRIPNEKAARILNLDEIPFPDWEQMSPNSYPKAPHGAIVKHFPVGVITSTRGCPYTCTFCASPKFYDRRIRFRSPENVVAEITYLVEYFGVKEVHFEDDNLTLNRSHITRICQLLLEKGTNVSWACPNGIRADTVDKSLMQLMKKSGCHSFTYGIESANPQILHNIKKQVTIETIERSINMASDVGISCHGFFIFGLPGETIETINESIRFAKHSKLSRAHFGILYIMPGTELWDVLKGKFVHEYWAQHRYGKEPNWLPDGLTREDLIQSQNRAFREFYLNGKRLYGIITSLKPGQLKYMLQRITDYKLLHRTG